MDLASGAKVFKKYLIPAGDIYPSFFEKCLIRREVC
jgi:hypothetical protein